ncbi:MAG: LemA family protein [Bacteroidetes bacterium]|jgi:LemA protein|nr:LemA family protein [Bacteroidota bacterium]MBQ9508204.1 LemA family protein [Bacteroidales bacterium]
MSKLTKILIIVGIIAVVILWGVRIYNNMVKLDEETQQAWAQVENAYQRRADLIPNLVKTVQGAAEYEKGTLEGVIEARSKATSVQVDPSKLTEENIAAFQQVQDQLSSALSRLMVVVERYPELKANQNFLELQAQLEGTENRIAVERKKFNEVVQQYNTTIRRFPNNIFAGMFNFDKKGYFKAKEGADEAPDVEFNFN